MLADLYKRAPLMMDVCEAKLKAGVCQTVSNGLASTTGWPSFNLWQLHLFPTSCNWAHPGFHNMDPIQVACFNLTTSQTSPTYWQTALHSSFGNSLDLLFESQLLHSNELFSIPCAKNVPFSRPFLLKGLLSQSGLELQWDKKCCH